MVDSNLFKPVCRTGFLGKVQELFLLYEHLDRSAGVILLEKLTSQKSQETQANFYEEKEET